MSHVEQTLTSIRNYHDQYPSKTVYVTYSGGKEHPGAIKVEARKLEWAELLDIERRVQVSHPDFQIVDDEERLATQAALDAGTYPRGY